MNWILANWVDIGIILIIIFFALEGLGRNFFLEFVDFASFLLSFFLSLRFYNQPALYIEQSFKIPHSLASVLGFIAVWFLAEAILFILAQILLRKIKFINEWGSKLAYLSLMPAVLRGIVFIAVILLVVGTFPIQPKIKSSVLQSKIGSKILSYTIRLEAPVKNIFGGLTQDTLTFLTIKPQSNQTVNIGFQTLDFKPDPILEEEMVSLVNSERVKKGFKALVFDSKLREVGRSHSQDMFKRGYFSHYSPEGKSVADRAEGFGVSYKVIGENLAYAPNLDLAHSGLMNSEGHRANILSEDYGKIGIGIMNGGVYGLMITQVFSD